jgi:chromosome segregation ATPase
MASKPEGPERFTQAQRAGLEARHLDQDRTLAAIHRLEAALESAGPGRETAWRDEVISALAVLDESTTRESENASRIDSLLSDISRTQPRLRNRVRGVRIQYQQLRDRITSLRDELEDPHGPQVDIADLRQRLQWVLTSLRHQRARESDLIYEAYYEAFRADLHHDRM